MNRLWLGVGVIVYHRFGEKNAGDLVRRIDLQRLVEETDGFAAGGPAGEKRNMRCLIVEAAEDAGGAAAFEFGVDQHRDRRLTANAIRCSFANSGELAVGQRPFAPIHGVPEENLIGAGN